MNLLANITSLKGSAYKLEVYTIKKNTLDLVAVKELDRGTHYGYRTEAQHAAAEAGVIPKKYGGEMYYRDSSPLKIQILGA